MPLESTRRLVIGAASTGTRAGASSLGGRARLLGRMIIISGRCVGTRDLFLAAVGRIIGQEFSHG